MYLKLLHIILILAMMHTVCLSQSRSGEKIYGFVSDAETGEALDDVNIYISGSTIGMVSKGDGSFSFSTNLNGFYQIVFSHVGYKIESYHVTLNGEKGFHFFDVKLEKETLALETIEVRSSNREWSSYLETFKEQLLGNSQYAEHTYIENPWVLEFDTDHKNRLFAKSSSPLKIVNRALGYQIKLELVEFEWAPVDYRFLYLGRLRFEPISVFDPDIQQRWEDRRETAFEGSFEHFLRKLYRFNHKKDGYTIYRLNSSYGVRIKSLSDGELRYELMIRGVSHFDVPAIKGFRLERPARVVYVSPDDPFNKQTSFMQPADEDGIFFVFPNGSLLNPKSMILSGSWGQQRLADRVPVNYSPE